VLNNNAVESSRAQDFGFSLPPERVQVLGYRVAGILAFVGIAGIAIGIKILKKRQQLGAGLIGFFFTPIVIAIATFIFGP